MAWKQKLLKPVKPKLDTLDIAHNTDHSLRVFRNCELIVKNYPKADLDVLYAACLLHDIGQTINSTNEHSYNSNSLSENILKKCNLRANKIKMTMVVIKSHDNYFWVKDHGKIKLNLIEEAIFQDADRLESLGAMGIIRQMFWSSRHHLKIYDPNIPPQKNKIYTGNASPIHTIRDHQLQIYKHLNTPIAKKLAKRKFLFTKRFLNEFFNEWEFKYV